MKSGLTLLGYLVALEATSMVIKYSAIKPVLEVAKLLTRGQINH